jgi:hypothetical protein
MNLIERFDTLTPTTIDEFIADQKEENLHLDFKTADPQLSRDDRRNLAEAISGFANSEGGLIIWGVEARPNQQKIDCACAKKEIRPLSLFLSKLNQHTGGVQHRKIESDNDQGFAVTLVPASDAGPHMAKLGVDRYIKRSGSQFLRMEHFDIEDMFGRRKRPILSLNWRIRVRWRTGGDLHYSIVLGIENSGRGSAKAPFLFLNIEPPYTLSEFGVDGSYNEGLPRLVSGGGTSGVRFGGTANVIIHPGTVCEVTAITGDLPHSRDSLEDLVIHYTVTAEDVRMRSDVLRVLGKELVAGLRGSAA